MSMAQANKPTKTMSSRLSEMKFMQRAAASSPASAHGTPPAEPASKRQRLSNGRHNATQSSQASEDRADDAALSSDRPQRSEDAEFEGADRGDTKWYLSVKPTNSTPARTPLRVVSAGFGALDAAQPFSARYDDESNDLNGSSQAQGRRSFGNFNRKVEDPKASGNDSASASDPSQSEDDGDEHNTNDDDDKEDSDDPTGLRTMLAEARRKASIEARARRETKRKEAGADSARLAEDRRKKRVKLNDSTVRDQPPRSKPKGPCYKCGKMGHLGVYCSKSVLSLERRDASR